MRFEILEKRELKTCSAAVLETGTVEIHPDCVVERWQIERDGVLGREVDHRLTSIAGLAPNESVDDVRLWINGIETPIEDLRDTHGEMEFSFDWDTRRIRWECVGEYGCHVRGYSVSSPTGGLSNPNAAWEVTHRNDDHEASFGSQLRKKYFGSGFSSTLIQYSGNDPGRISIDYLDGAYRRHQAELDFPELGEFHLEFEDQGIGSWVVYLACETRCTLSGINAESKGGFLGFNEQAGSFGVVLADNEHQFAAGALGNSKTLDLEDGERTFLGVYAGYYGDLSIEISDVGSSVARELEIPLRSVDSFFGLGARQGDFDFDGDVDFADFLEMRTRYGSDIYDFSYFLEFRANFGRDQVFQVTVLT